LNSIGQTTEISNKDPYIYVTGTAIMEVVPNEIYLKIILSEENRSDKLSLGKIEELFLDALEKLQINKENLSLADAGSDLIQIPWHGKKIIKSKKFLLMVKDVNTLSKLIDELAELDITNINVYRVNHSNLDEFKKQVRIKAILNAKEKAEYLTRAIGKDLGDLMEITENVINYIPRNPYDAIANTVGGVSQHSASYESNNAAQIEFEKIKLEFSINIKYKIKN